MSSVFERDIRVGGGSGGGTGGKFDVWGLLRRLPVRELGCVVGIRGREKVGVGGRWFLGGRGGGVFGGGKVWIEMRGRVVVVVERKGVDADGGWDGFDGDYVLEEEIVGVFSMEGGVVGRSRGGRGLTLVVRRRKEEGVVVLKFGNGRDCDRWEKALVRAAGERVVGLSSFEFIAPIGKGASGKVFLVKDRVTGERLALKVIGKKRVFSNRSGFRHAFDERLALEMTDGHPFFSRLRYAFQTRKNFYLAIDFYQGGDLFQYLRTHDGRLEECQARIVAAEVILALEHMHKLGFVYRDLKPENILLDSEGHVRLADFGLCKRLDHGLTATICGTHTYAAPEMLALQEYGKTVDFWALGTFLYHIVRGRTPYEARDLDQVIYNMNNRPIRFSASCSNEMVSVIRGLLEWHPPRRLGCGPEGLQELKRHPFFASLNWELIYRRAPNREGLFDYQDRQDANERDLRREKFDHIHDLMKQEMALLDRHNFDDMSSNNLLTKNDDFVKRRTAPAAMDGILPISSLSSCSSAAVAAAEDDTSDSRSMNDDEDDESGDSLWNAANEWQADELHELRNFDLSEWNNVEVDKDVDDPYYGDGALWPVSSGRRRMFDAMYMAGYSYTSQNKPY